MVKACQCKHLSFVQILVSLKLCLNVLLLLQNSLLLLRICGKRENNYWHSELIHSSVIRHPEMSDIVKFQQYVAIQGNRNCDSRFYQSAWLGTVCANHPCIAFQCKSLKLQTLLFRGVYSRCTKILFCHSQHDKSIDLLSFPFNISIPTQFRVLFVSQVR